MFSLLQGLIKIFFLKVEYEGELRISESNLFHSTNADEKKKLRRKLFLTLNSAITKFWPFLVWYELLFEGLKWNKYFGECFFNNFGNDAKFFETIIYFEEILILAPDKFRRKNLQQVFVERNCYKFYQLLRHHDLDEVSRMIYKLY